ncbi:hypothetical protein OpiT1DRAFT_01839 [Opitutaceae bacterium TAV1]|nr:hypothetical protein OpiT1DRAFT_01839 [Opitutaceae bacterium TAV1]
MRLLLPALLLSTLAVCSTVSGASWEPVPPVDFSKISVADFSDDDLDLVTPLAHFAQLANAVRENDPDRGFIDLVVWRNAKDNQPYNARIMENVLSLAWFYTADRTWNPYRGHPAVKARLEAALDFIGNIQAPDGAFSEYGPQKWNLAATGFMTKFLGETLELLAIATAPDASGGPVPIDASVLERAHATQRKALVRLFARDDYYRHATIVTNQYGNAWPGGLAWLHLHPDDAEIRALWEKRFRQSTADFQSPAGYFYEAKGPDFGYTLGTHASNTAGAWFYLRGTPFADQLIEEEKHWFEFLSYNTLLQPGANWFAVNRAIETRQSQPVVHPINTPMAEFIPEARALSRTREEQAAILRQTRERLTSGWPGVAPLKVGDFWAYTPYVFQKRRASAWYPDQAQRDEARKQLPYLARDRFNHLRRDPRYDAQYYYTRRPAWYGAFATGARASRKQRLGLGLLWRPDTGILLQGQAQNDQPSWGTHAPGASLPFEYEGINATLAIAGKPAPAPLPLAADLPDGDVALSYPLGSQGDKIVTLKDSGIDVRITAKGDFEERFPFILTANDTLNHGHIVSCRLGRAWRPFRLLLHERRLTRPAAFPS